MGTPSVSGLMSREGLSTFLEPGTLSFQTSFLDGLIDLPTSIYWCNSSVKKPWRPAKASGIDEGQREFSSRMTARTLSPCQSCLLCTHSLPADSRVSPGGVVLLAALTSGLCFSSLLTQAQAWSPL